MFKVMGSSFLIAIVAFSTLAVADDAKTEQMVRKLTVKVGLPELGKIPATRGVTTFHSSEEAEKSLGEGTAKQLAGQIDFAKENLVLIGWVKAGPPLAKLVYEVKDEKEGKVIRFHLQPPKPSRVHGNVAMRVTDFFAVLKGVNVEFGRTPPPAPPGKAKVEETDDGKAEEFRGTLRTGVMAIGGETTGTIINVGGKTYELEFRTNPKVRDLAEKLNGKVVIVKGALHVRQGIEIKERKIISVTDLRPVENGDDQSKGTGEIKPSTYEKTKQADLETVRKKIRAGQEGLIDELAAILYRK